MESEETLNTNSINESDSIPHISDILLKIQEHFVTLKEQLDVNYQEHNIRAIVNIAKRVKLFEKVFYQVSVSVIVYI